MIKAIRRAYTKVITLGFSALFLLGCAQQNQPDQSQYYLLASNSQVVEKTSTRSVIGLNAVTVADYINSPGIALQTGNNRIQIANFHLWAEQPDQAITRVLFSELNQRLTYSRVENGLLGRSDDWRFTLSTQVDQFHGTEEGIAIFSGYWQLKDQYSVLISHRFNLQMTIEEPGYAALVSSLRQLLDQLAQTQAKEIQGQLEKTQRDKAKQE